MATSSCEHAWRDFRANHDLGKVGQRQRRQSRPARDVERSADPAGADEFRDALDGPRLEEWAPLVVQLS